MRPVRRRFLTVLALVLLVLGGLAAHRTWGLLHIGVAYKAKMLCSAVFVSGRPPAAAAADLAVDDLAPLRYVETRVGTDTVSARLLGVSYHAVHRPGLGCTLIHPDFPLADTPAIPVPAAPMEVPPLPVSRPLAAVLDWAFAEPDPAHRRRTRAAVILQDGRVIAERYAPGIGADTPLPGWSMTKTAMNALVGRLVEQGELRLDDPAPVPAWAAPDDPRRAITIGQLLQMNSGLAFNEDYGDPLHDVTYMLTQVADMAAYAAEKPLQDAPGSVWHYSSGTTNILSAALRRVIGDQAYATFPRRALFAPLGTSRAVIEQDAAGTFVGSSFMYATAREWARLGQLYLQDGVWNGQRLLPAGWVHYTTLPAPHAPDGVYGAHVWLRLPAEYRSADEAALPADAFHAIGHEGQFLTIIPSHRLVIVRMGLTRHPQAWQHDRFVQRVLQAVPR